MHDRNGKSVEVGDTLILEFKVESTCPGAESCNVSAVGLVPDGIEVLPGEIPYVTTNSKLFTKVNLSEGMSFGIAIAAMKDGKKIRLPKWAPDVFISLQTPDEHSKMTAPYMYVTSRFGLVPWIPPMIEMLSEEWALSV